MFPCLPACDAIMWQTLSLIMPVTDALQLRTRDSQVRNMTGHCVNTVVTPWRRSAAVLTGFVHCRTGVPGTLVVLF
jgi:hypothetical protein